MTDKDLLARVRAVESSDVWTYHSRASETHRYITVAVPKIGCSTIKRTLHAFEGLPPAERLALEHEAGEAMRLNRFKSKDAVAALTSPDWLRFTFVRNPYDRMLSAWKSKILAPHDTQYAPLRAGIRTALAYPSTDDSLVVAFGDFVRFVTSCDDPKVTHDGHWDTQVRLGQHDVIPYDVIGRFESFADDFASILVRLHAPAHVLAIATEVTNPTSDLPSAAAYDTEIAAIVYDYYRADFDAFGYDRDSWYMPRGTTG